jgi:hypothetical protein
LASTGGAGSAAPPVEVGLGGVGGEPGELGDHLVGTAADLRGVGHDLGGDEPEGALGDLAGGEQAADVVSADRFRRPPGLVVLDDLAPFGLGLLWELVLPAGAVAVAVPVGLRVDAGVDWTVLVPAGRLDPHSMARAAGVLVGVEGLVVAVDESIEDPGQTERLGAIAVGPLLQDRDTGPFVLCHEALVPALPLAVLADAGGDVEQAVGVLDRSVGEGGEGFVVVGELGEDEGLVEGEAMGGCGGEGGVALGHGQGVTHPGPGGAGGRGDLGGGEAEVEELLVAAGLFELGEVVAAQVLDEDGQHLVAVIGQVGPRVAGHGGQTGGDGRGLAAVPGKDPVAVVGGHDHEKLEHADLTDEAVSS